jgi:hypothetical protein
MFIIMLTILSFITGCCGPECQVEQALLAQANGGGRDAITVNLPFAEGDSYRCVAPWTQR